MEINRDSLAIWRRAHEHYGDAPVTNELKFKNWASPPNYKMCPDLFLPKFWHKFLLYRYSLSEMSDEEPDREFQSRFWQQSFCAGSLETHLELFVH